MSSKKQAVNYDQNAIIVFTAEDFQKAYREFGNVRGLWIFWADKGGSIS